MQAPREQDLEKLEQVGLYIKATREMGLHISPRGTQIFASTDASFAVHSDRKSHSGVTLWLNGTEGVECGNAPFEFHSSKQGLVTTSSTEAELVALHKGGESVVWARGIMEEMGFPQNTTEVQVDNKSMMVMAKRGPGLGGAKAIDVKYYWITEHIQKGAVELKYTHTDDLISDGFTKPLARGKFFLWRSRILNLEH